MLRGFPALLLLAGIAAPLLAPGIARAGAPAQDRVRAGAQAVAVRLVPYVGVPGFTATLGTTTAQVDSGAAAASAGAGDFGLLGTLINANAPEGSAFQLPEPITAASGRTEKVERDPLRPPGSVSPPDSARSTGAPPIGSGAHESVSATADPLAAVGSARGPELLLPGLLQMTGGTARSAADAIRATAEVTLGQLVLGDGAVVLSGMRWTAVKAAGPPAVEAFELSGMTISGQPVPVGTGTELAAAFEAANKALEPAGLSIAVPIPLRGATEAAVTPLIVQLRSPESLVEPGAAVSAVAKPAVLALTEAALKAYPDAATAQIVVNALVGASSGRSGGRLEFGGVSARSDLLPAAGSLPGSGVLLPGAAPVLPAGPLPPGSPPAAPAEVAPGGLAAGLPSSRGEPAPAVAPVRILGQPSAAAAQAPGGRGAAAVALGVGLALLLLLAAADRLRSAG